MGSEKSYLTLDIETVPVIRDSSVQEYLEDKEYEIAAHPVFSKVMVVGTKENGREPKIFCGENEKEVLNNFWEYCSNGYRKKFDRIVTFNGYKFDIPFLNVRTLANGIPMSSTVRLNTNIWRMRESNHFDCMLALAQVNKFAWVKLEVACKQLGIEVPEIKSRIRTEDLIKCYERGDWETIREYNKTDLNLTEKLYNKIGY
ncbi:hypothetical protein AKJ44_02485 [candidate division MSBL1 archaeon SCGC-AAA261F17]|uniref:Predicted 3'-5' exonuclease PolB-like domain-containing protein n=1 Tax=candidate division MSBL1 archaeon SCGC-AAA261F17 TaxID=1698274 RepID=A0A133V4Z2_9EURY|nr:hypothetical protein AKJ44_02485 [candidate division MSBL1 archaeon SCGC-AAA261F17]